MSLIEKNISVNDSEKYSSDQIVNSSGCFKALDSNALDYINEKKTQITYLKGETIFKQGAFAPFVLYVNRGLVKIYLQTGRNKQMNLMLAKQGDFMAFSSVFGEDIYSYSSVALKDSDICMIEKEALKKVLLENPEFALNVTSANFKNDKRYLNIITDISYKQMRGKLASALLYLTADEFANEEVFKYLNRKDIADFASITHESTIRFLKEFEKERILKLDGKNVILLDKKRLEIIHSAG